VEWRGTDDRDETWAGASDGRKNKAPPYDVNPLVYTNGLRRGRKVQGRFIGWWWGYERGQPGGTYRKEL